MICYYVVHLTTGYASWGLSIQPPLETLSLAPNAWNFLDSQLLDLEKTSECNLRFLIEVPEAQRVKELAKYFAAKLGKGDDPACVKSESLTPLSSPGLQVEGERMEMKRKARVTPWRTIWKAHGDCSIHISLINIYMPSQGA